MKENKRKEAKMPQVGKFKFSDAPRLAWMTPSPYAAGVYSAMVLVVLLMAVPIQLLCSHFLGKADKDGNDPRALAMARY